MCCVEKINDLSFFLSFSYCALWRFTVLPVSPMVFERIERYPSLCRLRWSLLHPTPHHRWHSLIDHLLNLSLTLSAPCAADRGLSLLANGSVGLESYPTKTVMTVAFQYYFQMTYRLYCIIRVISFTKPCFDCKCISFSQAERYSFLFLHLNK